MNHIVALSGGKDSTAMALRLTEVEPRAYLYVCTPTGDEPEAFFAHLDYLRGALGQPILPIMHPLGLNGLIAAQNALPNFRMRWCTRLLKINPYRAWLAQHAPACSYVGLRADETGRAGGAYDDLPGITHRFPLQEWGWMVEDVWAYLDRKRIVIPRRLDCQRCFFQTLYEWWLLWREHPDVYADAEAQEQATGHTFRSPGRDTWPTSLADLRAKFASGFIPKQRLAALQQLQCRMCTLQGAADGLPFLRRTDGAGRLLPNLWRQGHCHQSRHLRLYHLRASILVGTRRTWPAAPVPARGF